MKSKAIDTTEFYYPQTGKWYRYTDNRDDAGQLISRKCDEIIAPDSVSRDKEG